MVVLLYVGLGDGLVGVLGEVLAEVLVELVVVVVLGLESINSLVATWVGVYT